MLTGTDVLFLVGADELDLHRNTPEFTVYIGTHGVMARIMPTSFCQRRPTLKNRAPMSIPKAGCRLPNRAGFAPGDAKGLGHSAGAFRCPGLQIALRFAGGLARRTL